MRDIPITQTRIGQDVGGYANVVVGKMIIFSQALSHSDRRTWGVMKIPHIGLM